MKSIYTQIPEFSKKLSPLVLASVIFTRGSAPQKSGNSALFSRSGLIEGTIGGGILEGRVQQLASEAAISGQTGIYHFELDKGIENKSEAICGGRVSVLIESGIERYNTIFTDINNYLLRRIRCAMITVINGISGNSPSVKRIVFADENTGDLPYDLKDKVTPVINNLLADRKGGNFSAIQSDEQGKDELILIEAIAPLPQLIIAGAGHIGRALHHLGSLLDFEVTVIDNRSEFANPVNLPDARNIIVKDIAEAFIR
jgi:xanthine dehydrogenase accessory factor